MFPNQFLVLLVLCLAVLGHCKSKFTAPSVGDYYEKMFVPVEWESDDADKWDVAVLEVYPGGSDKTYRVKIKNGTTKPGFTWNATLDGLSENLRESSEGKGVLQMELYKAGSDKVLAKSPNFGIVLEDAETTTIDGPRDTATSESSSAVSTPASNPSVPTTSSSGTSGSQMSTGTVAGISVGSTVGGLLLLGGLGFFARKRFSRRGSDEASQDEEGFKDKPELADTQKIQPELEDTTRAKPELADTQKPQELPAEDFARSPPGLHEAP
ncbi:crumbs 3 [Fusarium albosuccineum]|uniref:Crumbs 3 n=1 Tax=Fusarium albosuccineum TaxID=1237068 RepID=A0A8H4L7B5_9HYPO|nr:crumbs 3 [Fusarium albosuccineum]